MDLDKALKIAAEKGVPEEIRYDKPGTDFSKPGRSSLRTETQLAVINARSDTVTAFDIPPNGDEYLVYFYPFGNSVLGTGKVQASEQGGATTTNNCVGITNKHIFKTKDGPLVSFISLNDIKSVKYQAGGMLHWDKLVFQLEGDKTEELGIYKSEICMFFVHVIEAVVKSRGDYVM